MDYDVGDFVGGYKNAKSRFEYVSVEKSMENKMLVIIIL